MRSLALLLLVIVVGAAERSALDWLDRGGLLLGVDNDAPAGRDDRYTAGTRLSLVSRPLRDFERSLPVGLDHAVAAVPGFTSRGRLRYLSLQLSQRLFTPERLSASEPITDDLPYAGLLTLGLSAVVQDERRLQSTSLVVGLIGPSAGGEATQRTAHRVTGSTTARGWDHQQADRAVASIGYEERLRLWRSEGGTSLDGDLIASGALRLGNLVSAAEASLALRWGLALPADFALRAPFLGDEAIGLRVHGESGPRHAAYATLQLGATAWGGFAPLDLDAGIAGSGLERRLLAAFGFAGLSLHHRRLLLRGGLEASTVPWDDAEPLDWFGRFDLGYRL